MQDMRIDDEITVDIIMVASGGRGTTELGGRRHQLRQSSPRQPSPRRALDRYRCPPPAKPHAQPAGRSLDVDRRALSPCLSLRLGLPRRHGQSLRFGSGFDSPPGRATARAKLTILGVYDRPSLLLRHCTLCVVRGYPRPRRVRGLPWLLLRGRGDIGVITRRACACFPKGHSAHVAHACQCGLDLEAGAIRARYQQQALGLRALIAEHVAAAAAVVLRQQ